MGPSDHGHQPTPPDTVHTPRPGWAMGYPRAFEKHIRAVITMSHNTLGANHITSTAWRRSRAPASPDTTLPDGHLVVADTPCCFDPVYGQCWTSSSAAQARPRVRPVRGSPRASRSGKLACRPARSSRGSPVRSRCVQRPAPTARPRAPDYRTLSERSGLARSGRADSVEQSLQCTSPGRVSGRRPETPGWVPPCER